MSVSKSDLQFRLTGADILVAQTNAAQSIGGYPSTTAVNPSAILSTAMDLVSPDIYTTTAIQQPYAVLIADELIKVSNTTSLHSTGTRGSLQTDPRYHNVSDLVYSVNKGFFNNSFTSDFKQYRCIAVTNAGTGTFTGLKFYLKFTSRNANSALKIGIECPSTNIITGTSTGGSSISLVDTTLVGSNLDAYDSNVLMITSGSNANVGRAIASFDKATGTFTFLKAFPYSIAAGITYRVENGPAQRIASGTVAPTGITFTTPTSYNTAIAIPSAGRTNGANLGPKETVYLWFERSITDNMAAYLDNRFILTASYT